MNTLGPWTVEIDPCELSKYAVRGFIEDDGERYENWVCREATREDAQLIAAALTMRAACIQARAVLQTAERGISDPLGKGIINRRIKTLTAAIEESKL